MNFSVQQVAIFPTRDDAQKTVARFDEWDHARTFAKSLSLKREAYRVYLWREQNEAHGAHVDSVYQAGAQVR